MRLKYIRGIWLLMMMVFVAMPICVFGSAYADENHQDFEVHDGVLTAYHGQDTEIVIPEYLHGERVVAIGSNAFANSAAITAVYLPDTVISIGTHAFENCIGLSSVRLPNNLQELGNYAFSGCVSLQEIDIPGTVEMIGTYQEREPGNVFYNCTSLKTAILHDGTKVIGDNAFLNCTSLNNIVMPESLQIIGTWAFGYCESLRDVWLYDQLRTIGSAAFYGCKLIESILLPDSVTSIGTHCFRGCTKLAKVVLSEHISMIPYRAFSDCLSLKEIKWPKTLSGIDSEAFIHTGIEALEIPNGVQHIADRAFQNCYSLTSVWMTDSVLIIGTGCFENCTSLTNVHMSDRITVLPDHVFRNCEQLEEINIPLQTERIGARAFYGCKRIRQLVLPEVLTEIDEEAFYECTGLVDITNYSALSLKAGESVNGYVACYALNVSEEPGKGAFVTVDNGVFFLLDGEVYLLSCVNQDDPLYLPESFQGGTYRIAPYAFYNQTISLLKMPVSVTGIGAYAFGDGGQLHRIWYTGTRDDWLNIAIDIGNEYLEDETFIIFENEMRLRTEENASWWQELKNIVNELLSNIFLNNFVLTLIWGLVLLVPGKRGTEQYQRRKKQFIIIVCAQWVLISTLRADSVGADTANYMRLFDMHNAFSWSDLMNAAKQSYLAGGASTDYELGYIILEKLIGTFTSSHLVYKFLVATIFMSAFGSFLYKNSEDPFLSFMIYDALMYNMFSLTGYRQVVSVAIGILLGYEFVKKQKLIPFLTLVFFASLFHRTTLVFIPFYFLANKKATTGYVVTALVVVAALILTRNSLFAYVKVLLDYDQYSGTYGFAQQTFLALLVLLTVAVMICRPQMMRYASNRGIANIEHFYNALILTWIMVPFAMVSPTSMRLVYDFGFISLLLIVPIMVKSFPKQNNRVIAYALLIVLFGYFIATKSLDYQFFWQV